MADTSMAEPDQRSRNRPRLAVWSPFPPQHSGVADYTEELLRCLTTRYEAEVFVDDGCLPPSTLLRKYRVQHFTAFRRRHEQEPFDLVIYQLGRSLHHLYMYDALQQHPGVVVLHELGWSHVLHRDAVDRGRSDLFEDHLFELEGERALTEFRALRQGPGKDRPGALEDYLNRHPMLGRVVERSLAQIVHFDDAAEQLHRRYPDARPFVVPMGVADPYDADPRLTTGAIRGDLDIPDDAFVVAAFGIVHPVKRLHACIAAFAELTADVPEARLVLVGPVVDGRYVGQLSDLADRLGVFSRVRITGHVARRYFDRYLLACDVVVNLRTPSTSHVSATMLRALAGGKPVLVSDVPDWSFLSDESVIRVPSGDDEVPALSESLTLLASARELRRRLSSRARRAYLAQATLDRMGEGYARVIESLLPPVPTSGGPPATGHVTEKHRSASASVQ